MIFLLILVFIGAIWVEVPGLIRKKYFRELTVFSVFLLTALVLALLQVMGVKIPTISSFIEYLVKDLLHLNYK